MSTTVEQAIAAAFDGPEVKKLNIFSHKFNIKKMEHTVGGGTTTAHGQISHCLANRPDDQIYYDITVVNGQVTVLQRKVEHGGWSKIWAAVTPFVSALTDVEEFNDKRIIYAITQTEDLLNGEWLGVVDYLLGLFAIKIAAGFTTGQMSQALTAQSQLIDGYAVYGDIRNKYDTLGGRDGFLGKPLTDETGTPDGVGRYNHFEHGSIYWTQNTDAWEVHGSIRDEWASLGWERSQLGYPISDEQDLAGGGRVSRFQHGRICWGQDRGAWVEKGLVLEASRFSDVKGHVASAHAQLTSAKGA